MELAEYFKAMKKQKKPVSKQDYFKQRKKLNPEVFKVLNQNYLKQFYEGEEPKGWRGYLVMATDGSQAEIPNSEENRKTYGVNENQNGKMSVRASISTLYDVYNRFIIDIGIHHYKGSEISHAKRHIAPLMEITGGRKALIIFDRGYASLEFIDFLEKSGVYYLIRLQPNDFKAEAAQMRRNDEWVEIKHTTKRLYHLKEKMPEREQESAKTASTSARMVKTVFKNDEQGILLTNLKEGSTGDIQRLYRKRWMIEQKFHTLKNKMRFESVTGKAGIYVQQDFWAQMLVFNIIQDLITSAEMRAVRRSRKKQHRYEIRINENIAIGLFKKQFIDLMMEDGNCRKEAMFRSLTVEMEQFIVPVRINQKSSPRKWKNWNKYKCNQKPSF
jgi:hypothetical protein